MDYNPSQTGDLLAQYGSPLYCFCPEEFAANYREFVSCFQAEYEHYRLAYSFKTNYTPAVCQLVKQLGGYAEVVSDMELELAKKLGYKAPNIIYNGPGKGALVRELLLDGGMVNADGLDELQAICDFAKAHPETRFEIGLRVNIQVGQPFLSRFGIDADSAELDKAMALIAQTENLTLAGLHCHVSQARALESWKQRTQAMLSLADRLFDGPPKYLDFGSGMYGKMAESFAAQFSNVPSYQDYARVTARMVAEHYRDCSEKPLLFTEPGTTVINKYVDFLTRIIAIKTIQGKTFVVTDGSAHNLGEVCKLKKLPVTVIPGGQEEALSLENADIVGYTCLEHDVMYPGFSGNAAVGDYLVFGNVGGYSNVSKPPFIHPNCAMISLEETGESRLIKRPETAEDIFRTYLF